MNRFIKVAIVAFIAAALGIFGVLSAQATGGGDRDCRPKHSQTSGGDDRPKPCKPKDPKPTPTQTATEEPEPSEPSEPPTEEPTEEPSEPSEPSEEPSQPAEPSTSKPSKQHRLHRNAAEQPRKGVITSHDRNADGVPDVAGQGVVEEGF